MWTPTHPLLQSTWNFCVPIWDSSEFQFGKMSESFGEHSSNIPNHTLLTHRSDSMRTSLGWHRLASVFGIYRAKSLSLHKRTLFGRDIPWLQHPHGLQVGLLVDASKMLSLGWDGKVWRGTSGRSRQLLKGTQEAKGPPSSSKWQ